jgi:hypothetical protein
MVVNAELLNTIRARVDQPESVLLARSELEHRQRRIGMANSSIGDEGAVVGVFAIYQIAVAMRREY